MEISFARYRPTQPTESFLLAADIGGTLLGDEQGAAWLKVLSIGYHSRLPAAQGVLDGLKFFGFIEEMNG